MKDSETLTEPHLRKFSLVLMAIILSAAGCQRPEVHTVDDAALADAVRKAFAADHDIQGATARVEIHAKDGVVTLTGTADTAADKARAEQTAQRTGGVKTVINQIVIAEPSAMPQTPFDESSVRDEALKSGEKIGKSSDDARIYDAVRRKLVEHAGTSKKEIFVDVENRNVTLRGRFVGTAAARDEAIAATRSVPGVNAVINRLTVSATTSRP